MANSLNRFEQQTDGKQVGVGGTPAQQQVHQVVTASVVHQLQETPMCAGQRAPGVRKETLHS